MQDLSNQVRLHQQKRSPFLEKLNLLLLTKSIYQTLQLVILKLFETPLQSASIFLASEVAKVALKNQMSDVWAVARNSQEPVLLTEGIFPDGHLLKQCKRGAFLIHNLKQKVPGLEE